MKAVIGIILLAITISAFAYVCAWISWRQEKKAVRRKRINQYKKVNVSDVWHRSTQGIWYN